MPLQFPADPQIIQIRSASHGRESEGTVVGAVLRTEFPDRLPLPFHRKVSPGCLGIMKRWSLVAGEAGESVEHFPFAFRKVSCAHLSLDSVFAKMYPSLHLNLTGKFDH